MRRTHLGPGGLPQPSRRLWWRVGGLLAGAVGVSTGLLVWSARQGPAVIPRAVLLNAVVLVGTAFATDGIMRRHVLAPWQRAARQDERTGVYRAAAFWHAAEQAVTVAAARGLPVAFVFFDLDNFKRFNDSAGHLAGDAVLTAFGAVLRAHARATDVLGRLGGEEFGWCLPGATAVDAAQAADRERQACAAHPDMQGVTVSAGVAATTPRHPRVLWNLVHQADAALYRAKAAGKSRVVMTAEDDTADGGPV